MLPSEQTPHLPPKALATSQTTPPAVGLVVSASSGSNEASSALALSLGDRFRSEVLPLLSTIRRVEPSDNNSLGIKDFQAVIENPEVRAVAWEHIGTYGVPHNLSLAQRQILAETLMPHVETDKEQSWNAFIRMTALAASSEDMKTYELAGKTALSAGLPNLMIELLAQPFAAYATHNAERVSALAPWMKLFTERGSEDTCAILIDTMVRRLEAQELSSYDHILSVLCQSRQPLALYAIGNFANPPIFDENSVKPPVVFLLRLSILDAAYVLPYAFVGTYLFGGIEMMTSPYTLVSTLALGLAHTFLMRRPGLKEIAGEVVAEQQALAKSSHYRHFADRVFEKLCALPSDRRDAAEILDIMETHPAFENKRTEWRELRAHYKPQG